MSSISVSYKSMIIVKENLDVADKYNDFIKFIITEHYFCLVEGNSLKRRLWRSDIFCEKFFAWL